MSKKISYAEKDTLAPDEFNAGKIRISMFIDIIILEQIKRQAEANGKKYQTYIQEILFNHVTKPQPSILQDKSDAIIFFELIETVKKLQADFSTLKKSLHKKRA